MRWRNFIVNRRALWGAVLLFSLAQAAVCGYQSVGPPAGPAVSPAAQSIPRHRNIDPDVVLVHGMVTGPKKDVLPRLEKKHFRIWEDDAEQEISYFEFEEQPISVGINFAVSDEALNSDARRVPLTF